MYAASYNYKGAVRKLVDRSTTTARLSAVKPPVPASPEPEHLAAVATRAKPFLADFKVGDRASHTRGSRARC